MSYYLGNEVASEKAMKGSPVNYDEDMSGIQEWNTCNELSMSRQ